MLVRPPTMPVAHLPRPRHPRLISAARYTRRWALHWFRMAVIGFAAGLLIGGLYNQATTPRIEYGTPAPAATHARR